MSDFQAAYRRLLGMVTSNQGNAAPVLRCTSEVLVGPVPLTGAQRALMLNLSGTCRALLGRTAEAVKDFEAALQSDVGGVVNLLNCANLHKRRGQTERALSYFQRARQSCPESTEAAVGAAGILIDHKRDYVRAHAILSGMASRLESDDTTEGRQGLRLLCVLAHALGHTEEASRILKVVSGSAAAPLLLSEFYEDTQAIDRARAEFLKALRADAPCPFLDLLKIGLPLSYQGRRNLAALREVERYCRRAFGVPAREDVPESADARERSPHRLRVAFLSANLNNHSVTKDRRGIIERLDRTQFEVIVLTLEAVRDAMGGVVCGAADRHIVLDRSPTDNTATILRLNLDCLVYPDIGLESRTYWYALHRLAPVQLTTWGHSETSGLETIDYFVSSALFEPASAQENYCERLITMRSLSTYYHRPPVVEGRARWQYGLPTAGHMYLVPATMIKLHPDFDQYMLDVLRGDEKGFVVLITDRKPGLVCRIRGRLDSVLGPSLAPRVHLVPYQEAFGDFLGLLSIADVIMDSHPFGGCNTSFEAFACGVPVVTHPSRFLNGRFTAGLYRRMGFTDLVADDREQYTKLCLRLATDEAFARSMRILLTERAGLLFGEEASVTEWGETLQKVARRRLSPAQPIDFIPGPGDIVVIGNGPSAVHHPLGAVIDRFERVVRLNDYRTKGYELFVGDKTTTWAVSDQIGMDRKRYEAVTEVRVVCPTVKRDAWGRTKSPYEGLEKCQVVGEAIERTIMETGAGAGVPASGKWPSTGLSVLYHLVQECEKCYVVGFDAFEGQGGSLHYFEEHDRCDHDREIERKALRALEDRGKLVNLATACGAVMAKNLA
jgi:tetratricopeptide (TPR) repeat protein